MVLGDLQLRQGGLDLAISTLGEARQTYVILGDLPGELASLRLLGVCWTMLGDLLRARAVFSLGAELAHRGGQIEAEAVALCNAAMTYGEANEPLACTDLTGQALVLLRKVGDERSICHALVNISEGLTRLGRLDEADEAAAEGFERVAALGDARVLALFRGGRGERAAMRGAFADAEREIREARQMLTDAGLTYDAGQMTIILANALFLSGEYDRGVDECQRCLTELREGNFHGVRMALLDRLSALHEASGDTVQALRALRERQRQLLGFEQNPARVLACTIEERQRAQFAREGSKREQDHRNALVDANRQLSAALARERRERVVLQTEAVTDDLTAVLNRRGFMELAAISVDNSQRTGDPLAIAVLDLDHFKKVNDTFGHRAGDVVLREVAAAAASCLRGHDVFARIGGEEFVALISNADPVVAQLVAERMRAKVGSLRIAVQDALVCCTVSIGVASYVADVTVERLVECADAALYAAKREGRDRVVMYVAS